MTFATGLCVESWWFGEFACILLYFRDLSQSANGFWLCSSYSNGYFVNSQDYESRTIERWASPLVRGMQMGAPAILTRFLDFMFPLLIMTAFAVDRLSRLLHTIYSPCRHKPRPDQGRYALSRQKHPPKWLQSCRSDPTNSRTSIYPWPLQPKRACLSVATLPTVLLLNVSNPWAIALSRSS